MSSARLIRWSGVALALGGIAIALFVLALVPIGGFDAGGKAENTLTGIYRLSHGLHILGAVLALFGLVGLYGRLKDRTGWLGLIGFVLAFVGTSLFVGLGMIAEFIVPVLAVSAPPLLDPAGPLGASSPLFPLTFLPFLVGYILLGIATLRAGVLPRWSGLLLIIAAVLFALPVPWPVPVAGAIAYGAGLIWLGSALWGAAEMARP